MSEDLEVILLAYDSAASLSSRNSGESTIIGPLVSPPRFLNGFCFKSQLPLFECKW